MEPAPINAGQQTMMHGVRDLTHRAKTIAAWASSAALLLAGVTALRRRPPVPDSAKSSWFQKVMNGARLASTVWFALGARRHKEEHKQP